MPLYQDHRSHLNTIIKAALEAADPSKAVKKFLSRKDVREAKRVFIVGAGKAGVAMGEAAMEIVGERFEGGVVSVPKGNKGNKGKEGKGNKGNWGNKGNRGNEGKGMLRLIEGGHPKPNEGSIEAGEAIANLLKDVNEEDVVIAVISGGG